VATVRLRAEGEGVGDASPSESRALIAGYRLFIIPAAWLAGRRGEYAVTPSFVICGMEHSGTTLISDLFRQVPHVDSGFECGVLLCKTPHEFKGYNPYYTNMLKGWNISQSDLDNCCEANTYDEFYRRLVAASKVLPRGTTAIFDKTPRYFHGLRACLSRLKVPFIATYKDPRSVVCSDFQRSKAADFDTWYEKYRQPKQAYMRRCYDHYSAVRQGTVKRTLLVSLESLCLDTRRIGEELFAHVGLEFKVDYLLLKNLRYRHTRDRAINSRMPFEYKEMLRSEQQNRVREDFAVFSDWFYN
jgi:hypothetical protein